MQIRFGFLAIYLAVIGTLILLTMPLLEAYSATLTIFCLFPLGLIGLCMVAYEKLRTR